MENNGKIVSIEKAISPIKDGDRIMIGGFGYCGCPQELADELLRQGQKDLTIISSNLHCENDGIGKLYTLGRATCLIGTHYNSNKEIIRDFEAGKLPIILHPMGDFAELIRAGGFGIPAVYLRASVGTQLAEGYEVREFDGVEYVLKRAITADVALIKAYKADKLGNLQYRKAARNYNPLMATAAKYTVALVEEIVEVGELDPELIGTPHVYVDAVVRATK